MDFDSSVVISPRLCGLKTLARDMSLVINITPYTLYTPKSLFLVQVSAMAASYADIFVEIII